MGWVHRFIAVRRVRCRELRQGLVVPVGICRHGGNHRVRLPGREVFPGCVGDSVMSVDCIRVTRGGAVDMERRVADSTGVDGLRRKWDSAHGRRGVWVGRCAVPGAKDWQVRPLGVQGGVRAAQCWPGDSRHDNFVVRMVWVQRWICTRSHRRQSD